jgi:PAS domain S-box-containing protein
MTVPRNRQPIAYSLYQREHEARVIVDSMPGLAWSASRDGTPELLNARLVEYTGESIDCREPAIRGANCWWRTVLHADDVGSWLEAWSTAIETGAPWEIEHRLRRSDGAYRWFRASAQPVRDREGRLHRWYGLHIDIDDRMRTEDALHTAQDGLRKSELSLLHFLDAIPAIVWRATPDGEPNYMNQRASDYSGATLADFQDLKWQKNFVHPDDVANVVREWARARETETPYDVVARNRGADGSYRWFHLRAEPLRDEAGRIIHWYGVDVDIDCLKNVEEALRKSEQELRLLIDTLPAMVWRATSAGEPDYINQRLADYLGRPVAELSQQRWREILHPDDVDTASRDWAVALETGTPLAGQYRFRRADGAYRWFQFHSEPLRDVDGIVVHWYGVQVDIDDSKRMEDALRSTRVELSRASEMATVSQLAASIAHEISQPLAALVANAHASLRWISAAPPNLERAQIAAERIIRDGNAAADVVSRIRALFKRTDATRTLLDLNEVIGEVSRLIADEASSRNVGIAIDLEDGLPPTLADRVQLQQVIANLARNGVDAMESVDGLSRVLSIRSRRDGANGVLIEISDQGIGLEDEERVFEPFFTTKEQGMGMGLAICRWIVEAHQGRLWATRNTTRGATFSFTLPTTALDDS